MSNLTRNHEQEDPVQKKFLRGGWGGQCPNLKFSETSGARKRILGLQVNIDKANSRKYDVTR